MYLIAIAWMYVVVMMAVAEATGTGTVLGAIFTLLLYGLLPLGIVLYIFGTPGRRQMRKRREAEEAMRGSATDSSIGQDAHAGRESAAVVANGRESMASASVESPAAIAPTASLPPDGRDHAAGLPVASEGKEPGRL